MVHKISEYRDTRYKRDNTDSEQHVHFETDLDIKVAQDENANNVALSDTMVIHVDSALDTKAGSHSPTVMSEEEKRKESTISAAYIKYRRLVLLS